MRATRKGRKAVNESNERLWDGYEYERSSANNVVAGETKRYVTHPAISGAQKLRTRRPRLIHAVNREPAAHA